MPYFQVRTVRIRDGQQETRRHILSPQGFFDLTESWMDDLITPLKNQWLEDGISFSNGPFLGDIFVFRGVCFVSSHFVFQNQGKMKLEGQ